MDEQVRQRSVEELQDLMKKRPELEEYIIDNIIDNINKYGECDIYDEVLGG